MDRRADKNKTGRTGETEQARHPSGDDRCCVKLLELLMCKCPAKFGTCGPLYLRPLKKTQAALWYTEQAVGESKIKKFIAKRLALTTVARDSQTTVYDTGA